VKSHLKLTYGVVLITHLIMEVTGRLWQLSVTLNVSFDSCMFCIDWYVLCLRWDSVVVGTKQLLLVLGFGERWPFFPSR